MRPVEQGAAPRIRVLLEHQNPQVLARKAAALEAAGFDVDTCAGPSSFRGRRCPLTTEEGTCDKATAADVVLAGLPLGDIGVYIALRTRLPEHEVLLSLNDTERDRVPMRRTLEEIATLVPRDLDGDALVATVRDAAGASGSRSPAETGS